MSAPQVGFDYGTDADLATGDGDLAELANLALQQHEAEVAVDAAEEELNRRKRVLADIADKQIPEVMERLKLTEFKHSSGLVVKIEKKLRCSVPKDRLVEAIQWVEANGGADLVKRAFHIMFGRDEEGWANRFAADLRKRKKPVNVQIQRKVEPATLTAFLTRHLEQGTDVPLEKFGGFIQKSAKVTLPK